MLENDLKKLLRTTPKYLKILADHGITSKEKFLLYFPRDYEDRRNVSMIMDIDYRDHRVKTIKGKIVKKSLITTPK